MGNGRLFISFLLSVLLFVRAFGEGTSQTVKFEDETYNIETRWLDNKALQTYAQIPFSGSLWGRWGETNSAFVRDDRIYFTKMDIDGNPCSDLLVVNGSTGSYIGTVSIDWNGFSHSLVGAVYAGKDSEGTCYVASFGANISNEYPFDIFPLKFNENGRPQVELKYTLEMGSGWWVQSPSVRGNLIEGNFSVVAPVWNQREATNSSFQTAICIWTFSAGKYTGRQVFPANLTVADTQLISDDKLAVEDRHLWYSTGGSSYFNFGSSAIAANPTLYTVGNGTLTENSAITPAGDDDGYGNGMAFITLGSDRHFMIYASSGYLYPEFKLVYLPKFPDSFEDAKLVCVLTPKSAELSSAEPNDSRLQTKIFVEQPDANTANVFVAAHNEGMAAYTLSKEGSITTATDFITTEQPSTPEYFDLAGRRLPSKPAKGFYIIKSGPHAAKIFIP